MSKTLLLSLALVFAAFAGKALFNEAPLPSDEPAYALPAQHATAVLMQDPEFIGVDRCKICHRKEEDGEQFRIWEEGPHSKGFTVLATDEAKTIAAERGIDNPQTSDECLRCHVTAYNAPPEQLGSKYKVEDGVGCESCHGAGGDYYKKSTMEAITAGEIAPEEVGLNVPTEETCVQCHNDESPTFKGFDFEEYQAQIAHPIPESE